MKWFTAHFQKKIKDGAISVEEIQDMVEFAIMGEGKFDVAKHYITYRYTRQLARQKNTTDDQVFSLIDCQNEEIKQEGQELETVAEEQEEAADALRQNIGEVEPVSLETPIGEEEDSHLGDFIEDHDAPAPADAASFTLLREQLDEVLETLTLREKKVLELRFGLEDGRSRTLEEVGQHFGVTRERIRQIEAKALRKLRHPSRSKRLKDFLE